MWTTIINSITGILGMPLGTGGAALQGVAMAGTIWAALTDFRMWRSLGWLFLGILLMIVGFVAWNRRPIGGAIQRAAELGEV